MMNDKDKQLEKKAYEIAYAIFRISGNIKRHAFSEQLEAHGLSYFDSLLSGNGDSAIKEGRVLEYYIRLGGDVGLVHQDNVAALISEIGKANSEMRLPDDISESNRFGSAEPLKLSFSESAVIAKRKSEPKMTADIQKKEVPADVVNREIEAIASAEDDVSLGESSDIVEPLVAERPGSVQSEIRQSEILEKIRKFGNFRMKELQESFPNVTGRTLRYDLEKLAEKGLVERVGHAGPSTFYKAKEVVKYLSLVESTRM